MEEVLPWEIEAARFTRHLGATGTRHSPDRIVRTKLVPLFAFDKQRSRNISNDFQKHYSIFAFLHNLCFVRFSLDVRISGFLLENVMYRTMVGNPWRRAVVDYSVILRNSQESECIFGFFVKGRLSRIYRHRFVCWLSMEKH